MNKRIWLRHLALGIPLAALLHTCLQFAHAYSSRFDNDWDIFPLHWFLGVVFGSVVLGPAFSVQALLAISLGKKHAGRVTQIVAGGLLQGVFVWLWAEVIGIEPSLSGNFLLTEPMIAAGCVAGAIVAAFGAPRP